MKIEATYGVLAVSNRELSCTVEGGGGGFTGYSRSSPAADIALVLACTYGGAAAGLVAVEILYALLRSLP